MNQINQADQPTPIELLNLHLTNCKSTGPKRSKLYQKFNIDVSWYSILNEGYQCGLVPILYHIINNIKSVKHGVQRATSITKHKTQCSSHAATHTMSDDIDPQIIRKLRALYCKHLVINMFQFDELDNILNNFEKNEIDVIPLKGAMLARNYYPGQALRPMVDLDLLVRKEDIQKAKECMASMGFNISERPFYVDAESWENKYFHYPCVKHGKITIRVELHIDIVMKPKFIKHDILRFWETATPISGSYKHVLVITKELLLLHLLWHLYNHITNGIHFNLIWLLDIAYVIKVNGDEMDWSFVLQKSNEWHIQKHVYFSLNVVSQLLSIRFNSDIMSIFKPSFISRKLFNSVILAHSNNIKDLKKPNQSHMVLLDLISLDNISDIIKCLFKFFSPEWLRKQNSLSTEESLVLSYFFQPVFLIFKSFEWLYRSLILTDRTKKQVKK